MSLLSLKLLYDSWRVSASPTLIFVEKLERHLVNTTCLLSYSTSFYHTVRNLTNIYIFFISFTTLTCYSWYTSLRFAKGAYQRQRMNWFLYFLIVLIILILVSGEIIERSWFYLITYVFVIHVVKLCICFYYNKHIPCSKELYINSLQLTMIFLYVNKLFPDSKS